MTQKYLSVTALTKYLKYKFDADPHLGRVYLTGEISNFNLRSAHKYFSLKDENAKISAVMFKTNFDKLKFTPEEGMKVLVVGRVSLYEAYGTYQITIEQMEPDGVGARYLAFEQLKQKLAQEGLFQAPKKPIVKYPKKIAVITSQSGAVIRDIITTVQRRYPIAQIVLFPTVVQGEKSAPDIVRNIKRVEALGDFDTLIIGRGGGSIEDLWPFNEESVARAIFAAKTPIISSVGHETDTTIADFVADVRAATPTAAAELAVPVLVDEILRIEERKERLKQALNYQIQYKKERHQRLMNSYLFRQPERLYEGQSVRLDRLTQRLQQQMQTLYYEKEKQTRLLRHRLEQQIPLSKVREAQVRLNYNHQNLQQQMANVLQRKWQQFDKEIQALNLLSPLNIMGRGYSYTVDKKGTVVSSVQQLTLGEEVTIRYQDGQAQMKILTLEEKSHE